MVRPQSHLLHSSQHILYLFETGSERNACATQWFSTKMEMHLKLFGRFLVYKQTSARLESQIKSDNFDVIAFKCTRERAHRVFQPRIQNVRPPNAACLSIWWTIWWWCLIDRLIMMKSFKLFECNYRIRVRWQEISIETMNNMFFLDAETVANFICLSFMHFNSNEFHRELLLFTLDAYHFRENEYSFMWYFSPEWKWFHK